MKEYVLVEFIAEGEDRATLVAKLALLGDDFIELKNEYEYEHDEFATTTWDRVTGKISSIYASVIKLRDPFLADRMRISYIPDELKDKYRR